jgi:hypothetical protein
VEHSSVDAVQPSCGCTAYHTRTHTAGRHRRSRYLQRMRSKGVLSQGANATATRHNNAGHTAGAEGPAARPSWRAVLTCSAVCTSRHVRGAQLSGCDMLPQHKRTHDANTGQRNTGQGYGGRGRGMPRTPTHGLAAAQGPACSAGLFNPAAAAKHALALLASQYPAAGHLGPRRNTVRATLAAHRPAGQQRLDVASGCPQNRWPARRTPLRAHHQRDAACAAARSHTHKTSNKQYCCQHSLRLHARVLQQGVHGLSHALTPSTPPHTQPGSAVAHPNVEQPRGHHTRSTLGTGGPHGLPRRSRW